MNFEELPVFLRVKEVAEILRVSEPLIYKMIQEGKIDCIRLGKVIRVPREEVSRKIKEVELKQMSRGY